MRRSRPHGHDRRGAVGTVVVVALVLGACTGSPAPTPTASASESAAEEGTPIEQLEAEREALAAELASLRRTLGALRDALDEATAGDRGALERAGLLLAADLEAASDPVVARAAGDATAAATVDDDGATDADAGEPTGGEDGTTATDDAGDTGATATEADGALAPLLPGPVVSRATTVSYGDLLTTTLAAARSAGREGEPIVRFLEAPLAGALGTWQRAPDDLLAAIAEAGRTAGVDAAETAVLELDGEAPRALAWVVHGLTTDTPVEEAALRAAFHLAVIETALEEIS